MAGGRKVVIGGNWKCNGTKQSVRDLIAVLNKTEVNTSQVEVVVAPPALHLQLAQDLIQKNISVSAQNVSLTGFGAYTGEIAAEQLLDFGLTWTITGHSERRAYYGETDEIVAKKTKRALDLGLKVIFCIGETLEQRKADQTLEVLKRQTQALASIISEKDWDRVVIAYEPVWAIGTGVVATPAQAQEAHKNLRDWIASKVSATVAQKVRIIYGGSVNGGNCAELIALEDVDGFLVGGASLKPEFNTIIRTPCEEEPLIRSNAIVIIMEGTKEPRKREKRVRINMTLCKYEVVRKIARDRGCLRNFERMKKLFPEEYDFCPKTWILPFDFHDFQTHFNADGVNQKTFIIKPDHSCQGRGVFLTRNMSQINRSDVLVAQQYIARPLLITGKKFDLRIYVLVTSCAPLRVYLFKDGLHSNNFESNKNATEDGNGSKRSLWWFFAWLKETHEEQRVDALWEKIGDICLKSILAVQPSLAQDFGCDSPLDWNIKERLISQTFDILNISAEDKDRYDAEQAQSTQVRLYGVSVANTNTSGSSDNQLPEIHSTASATKHEQQPEQQDEQTASSLQKAGRGYQNLSEESLRSALAGYYTEFNSDRLKDLDKIVVKYLGAQEELNRSLQQKYGKSISDFATNGSRGGPESSTIPEDDLEDTTPLVDFSLLYPTTTSSALLVHCKYRKMLDASQQHMNEQQMCFSAPLQHHKQSEGEGGISLPPLKGAQKRNGLDGGRDCFGFTGTDKAKWLGGMGEKKPMAVPDPMQIAAAHRMMMGHSSQKLSIKPPTPPETVPKSKKEQINYGLQYRERLATLKHKPTVAMSQISFGCFD
ncbi:Triose-phosphate isomerase, partial [Globisporangium splendens]